MKRPSFQFYPGDWSSNPNLRRCTFAEKGIWLEVLCLMHDQPDYGVLRWPLKEIAEAVKCKQADLLALARKGVLKGDDKVITEPFVYVPRSGRKDGDPVTLLATQPGPVWYSSRMVKDEYVRTIRGESSRFGADDGDAPKPPRKVAPKPPKGDGSSSSSSPSEKEKRTPIPPEGGKPAAVSLKTWLAGIKANGEKPIPEGDQVLAYADEVGLPIEFLTLAWREFRHRYSLPDAKRYRDWRRVFRQAVRGNWLKLWWLDGQQFALTTVGLQAQRAHAKDAA